MKLSALLLGLVALSACSRLPTRPDVPPESALAPATSGPLAELIVAAEAAHPGQSGFRLIGDGGEAYALRARSAQAPGPTAAVPTRAAREPFPGASPPPPPLLGRLPTFLRRRA